MVKMGIVNSLAIFLQPLSIFVKLNNLLLHVRTVFFGLLTVMMDD